MRFLARTLLVLATLAGLFGVMPIVATQAAVGDACVTSDLKPGKLEAPPEPAAPGAPLICAATTPAPAQGFLCSDGTFFTGTLAGQCVANNVSCGVGGFYQAGVCVAPPALPTLPTAPSGFSLDPSAGGLPTGEQQPMCVNASPFIGGGFGVVSGTVLCYTGAGNMTGIYAYSDTAGGGGAAWNPFSPGTWNSLTLRDLYAGDDITAQGTLSAFGGAQIFSLDGNTGLQVNNSGVLLGSTNGTDTSSLQVEADRMLLSTANGADVTSLEVTKDGVGLTSTDGTFTSSLSVSSGTGISLVAVGSGPTAVSLDGTIGGSSSNGVGVLVKGDGFGNGTGAWADVLIASQSYSFGGSTGSGVIVNDSGVIVRSASTGSTYNEFGSGAANAAGSSLTNVIGSGGAGSVTNRIGLAGNAGTMVVNEIGTGGGSGATTNIVGNTNPLTSFTTYAGTSSMVVIQGALDYSTGQGASILNAPTQLVSGGSATTMLGASARYASVDQNGRMTIINGVAPQATSTLYIENGYGNTNGVAITERNALLTGGESSPTTLMLSDTGARFSNSTNGEPVVVSGIADGQGPFDATNVRQLDSGLASIAALAGLPAPQPGKSNALGIAVGFHNSGSAFAVGGQSLLGESLSIKYGGAVSYSNGLVKSSASLGMGASW